MARENRNIEFEEVRDEGQKAFTVRSLIDGNVLTQKVVLRQAPFIALIVLISFLSIANRNHAKKLVIRATELQKEVKELRFRAISTSAELMKMSRQSTVEYAVKARGLGLKENVEPPKKLVTKTD